MRQGGELINLDGLIQRACALLKHEEPGEGYHGCFSGGKDSVVIKELARIAAVKVTWYYNVTTIDPPELVRFIREKHNDVKWLHPDESFFSLMPKKMPPSRRKRWCCEKYKELIPSTESVQIIGVRIAESSRRKKLYDRCVMDADGKRNKRVFPVRLWSDEDVWQFIRSRKIPYCSLYDEGFKRLGCIGCPMTNSKNRLREFDRWPRYEALYRKAFQKFYERKKEKERTTEVFWKFGSFFQNGNEMFEWWCKR